MDINAFKKQYIKEELKITPDYGRILSMIDFGNVNYWFEQDRQSADNRPLANNEKIKINLEGLKDFASMFSQDTRFYYGSDIHKEGSRKFIAAVKGIFGRSRVFSKQIQYIRHHLNSGEQSLNNRVVYKDNKGDFVKIPKCNFDVEMSVDTIRLMDKYDTLVMFSSDADFVSLFRYLRSQGKKVILIKGGNIVNDLRKNSDLVVNAQNIKKYITTIEKQKPGI